LPVETVPEPPSPERSDGRPELWRAVGELPPLQRAAVIHRYVLDLTYADVATALGCSEEAARANAYEGRKKLRAMREAIA
jgi:RNA polymerase sigma factor (sigma-70 family)